MYALSEQQILQAWEVGATQHPLDRALTLLEVVFPGSPRTELAKLTIGQRDAHLLSIREQTFGAYLAGLARCPACQVRLEFSLSTVGVRTAMNTEPVNHIYQVAVDGYVVRFRVPTSLDLAAIVTCKDVQTARLLLVQRCVVQALQADMPVEPTDLSESVISRVATQMEICDPQAEVVLELSCSACGRDWSVLFDIVIFLWNEVSAHARRLLREVHTLAQAYGWREADILLMSATRRQGYLEMVTT